MSKQLVSELIAASDMDDRIVQEMYALFSVYYKGVEWDSFRRDLLKKDWVMLLRDPEKQGVQGFTSLRLFEHSYLGQPMTILYSGDTIIHQPYWNSMTLAKSWIRAVWELTHGKQLPLYWLLISSGFRTYRYLPVFFSRFYPCSTQATSPEIQGLMDDIALRLFGDQFDPVKGIVRFRQGATPLKEEFGAMPEGRLQDEHIRFFEQRNPGYQDGDELVCLTEIAAHNLTRAGKRMTR